MPNNDELHIDGTSYPQSEDEKSSEIAVEYTPEQVSQALKPLFQEFNDILQKYGVTDLEIVGCTFAPINLISTTDNHLDDTVIVPEAEESETLPLMNSSDDLDVAVLKTIKGSMIASMLSIKNHKCKPLCWDSQNDECRACPSRI